MAKVPRFDDYHRTIIGYHGTRRSTALQVVQRQQEFQFSRNRDDWLGHGIYFWEHAPLQAWWWAKRRQRRQNWKEPIAVLASMIRLGFCFDLLDPLNVEYLQAFHREYEASVKLAGLKTPRNANNHKYLDCAVFQYAYAALEAIGTSVDTCRAVYVPTSDRRVWTRSWISKLAHIQLCVRNPRCILGTWLVEPVEEETSNHEQGSAKDSV